MKQLGELTWVLEGPTNIGFIERNKCVILIDTGNDKESGRKINRLLKEKDWKLKTVINTHSNADHIGGNDYLQRNLNCEILAPEIENVFIEYPRLETAFLWGGYEIKELRNKFFQAKGSKVTRILRQNEEIEEGIRIINLPGHFMNMAGVLTPDNILFLADSLFGENILAKYKIPFIYDVAEYKNTLNRIKGIEAVHYVPSHGPIEEYIDKLADTNLDLVDNIEGEIIQILKNEKSFDEILKEICDNFSMELDCGQYALVSSTIRSFLSYMHDEEIIGYEFIKNQMLWKKNG